MLRDTISMQDTLFRSVLFDRPIPDDLAAAYEALAQRHGIGTALLVLLECRQFAEISYLPELPDAEAA